MEGFARELDDIRLRCVNEPERELVHLLVLLAERHALCATALGQDVIEARLARTSLDPETQGLVRYATAWARVEEALHAEHMQSALEALGTRASAARGTHLRVVGAASAWAARLRSQVTWRARPLAWAMASAVDLADRVSGRSPADVREALRHGHLRSFFQLCMQVERTGALCYRRMLDLLPDVPSAPAWLVDAATRAHAEEERHRRLYELLAATFDDADGLAAGESAKSLGEKLRLIGEAYLPRARRRTLEGRHVLGTGGQVAVADGPGPAQKLDALRRAAQRAVLERVVVDRAGALGKSVSDLSVVIKVSYMFGYHEADRSVVTDPELVDGLAVMLQELGCGQIGVAEARNGYDRHYQHRSIRDVGRYFGYTSDRYALVDLSADQVPHGFARGTTPRTISRAWQEADLRIVFGKMRSHPTDLVHLTLGSCEGIAGRCDDQLLAERATRRGADLTTVLEDYPPHFAVLDAYGTAADGVVGVLGCPRPLMPLRVYAGADALAVDVVAARHMGLADPRHAPLIRAAIDWFGDPSARTAVSGANAPIGGWRGPYHSDWSALVTLLAQPAFEQGGLLVPEFDEEAFEPKATERWWQRPTRRALQTLTGLRQPRIRGAA